MGNLRYLTPGERLAGYPADAHNAFFDTYKLVHQQGGPANGTGQTSSVETVTCLVQNVTGANITADFPILKLGTPGLTYDENTQVIYRGIVFSGTTPAASTAISNIAVLQGQVGNNQYRSAVLLGPTWCQVNVSDAAHTFAKPKASNVELASDATTGAPIIWKQSGTGVKWALILLGGGAGGSSTNLTFARVTTEVTPATNATTWGTGQVKLQDPATGTLAGTAIDVDNLWIGMTWVVDAQLVVDGGFDPPRVFNGTCAAVAW